MKNTDITLLRRMAAATALAAGLFAGSVAAQAETVLRVANFGEPDTLDPHNISGTWENRITGDMYTGLLTENAEGQPVAGAAESWTVSGDGKTYTFKIRNHTWSDGAPVTAHDFVYSLQRILSPARAAKYASLLYPIKNAEAVNSGKLADLSKIGARAVDDSTLEITLENSTPYFLEQLTHYTAWPVPKHVVEKHGDDWVKRENIVTNGPYMLDEYIPNTHVKLVKNPKFYDAANVSIDRVVFFPQEDRAAAIKRYRAGEVDVLRDFPSDQIKWLRENMTAEEVRISPYLGIYYYVINNTRPPFTDIRVRQALSMAIDREIITDKVMGTGELPAFSFVPPGSGNYGEPSYVSWKSLSQGERVAKAKAMLAEAGFGPDKPLKFVLRYNTSENHKRIAVAVASMWKKALGVQAELFNAEVKVHYNELNNNNFDLARAGWIADYNDAQNFLYLLETRTGVHNYGRFSDSEFDRLMDDASKTVDLKKRAKMMGSAEAIAMREQPIIPIYYYVSKNIVSPKVQGWADNTKDVHRTRYLTLAN